jgi:hypothetical protein
VAAAAAAVVATAAATAVAGKAEAAELRRQTAKPRPNWQQTIHEQGLVYDIPGRDAAGKARPYWDESVHYVFEMDEILSL